MPRTRRGLAPASMSKLMTVLMVFERLKEGASAWMTRCRSARRPGAWAAQDVRRGRLARIEDLLRGIIVQSGNDACIVIAEGLAGSEEPLPSR